MKNFLFVALVVAAFSGCSSGGREPRHVNVVKEFRGREIDFGQKAAGRKVLVTPHYRVKKTEIRDHSQSIYLEDSEVLLELIDGESGPYSMVKIKYDVYVLSENDIGGGFRVGQIWILSFDGNGELTGMKLKA